jgi:hypothetical protein
MSRTDWIEVASKENWPAARVRNVVKAIKEERVRKYGVYHMVPPNAPAKRITREDGAVDASRVPGSIYRHLQSGSGHLATFALSPSDQQAIDGVIAEILVEKV